MTLRDVFYLTIVILADICLCTWIAPFLQLQFKREMLLSNRLLLSMMATTDAHPVCCLWKKEIWSLMLLFTASCIVHWAILVAQNSRKLLTSVEHVVLYWLQARHCQLLTQTLSTERAKSFKLKGFLNDKFLSRILLSEKFSSSWLSASSRLATEINPDVFKGSQS